MIQSPITRAMLLAFTGFSFWAMSDALVRFLREYPVQHTAFITSLTVVALLLLLSPWLGGVKETITKPKLKLRLVRGLLLGVSNILSFITFTHLELATAYALIFIIPLTSKVLSVWWTGEKIPPRAWAISALGFIGVLIVMRPGLIPLNIGVFAALGLVMFFSSGHVLARVIGKENQTLLSLSLFQYCVVSMVMSFLAFPEILNMPISAVLTAMAIAVFAVIGSLCASNAFAIAPTAYVAPVHYTQMLWGIGLGAAVFGEYPDFWTLLGAGIIIASGLMLLKYGRQSASS